VRPNVRAKRTEEADAGWPRKDDTQGTWSGQAVAAVVGRRLSEVLGRTRGVNARAEQQGCARPKFGQPPWR